MKKALKQFVRALTAAVLVLPVLISISAYGQMTDPADTAAGTADSREEVVYANLTPTGITKNINVVSILHNAAAGKIVEFGEFSSVKNLTDTTSMSHAEDQVNVSAPKGDFYYQGTLKSTQLPWNIAISYTLDGSPVTADALAGANGHVVITIATTQNTAVDPVYFNNYLLQISVTFDTAKCANIAAPGGTMAYAGVNKQVTFTVMPGKEGALSLETDATDFSMAGIQLAAVPLSMKIDPPDTSAMMKDLSKLSGAVSDLSDGFNALENGSLELKNGGKELSAGSSSFASGLKKLSGNAGALVNGSAQIKDGLQTFASSMSGSGGTPDGSLNLGSLQQLPDGLLQLAAGLDGISGGLSELKAGFTVSYSALKAAILEIPGAAVTEEEWGQLYQDNPDKKGILDTLASYYAAGSKVKGTYDAVRPAFDAMDTSLDRMTAGVGQISATLKETATQIKTALESNDALAQLQQLSAGLTELAARYGDFHAGLTAFAAGTSELSKNYGALDSGIAGLAEGAGSLADGLHQASDGASELNDAVKDLPEKTDVEIAKLMAEYDKSDVRPSSFSSPKNVNTVSVQFVLKTDKIEKPAQAAPTAPAEQPETFWSRLLSLFS